MNSPRQTEGHVLMPTLAIGSLALVLAAGFGLVGLMDRVNELLGEWLRLNGGQEKSLPEWVVWAVAVLGAFGISAAILNVAGDWRRVVLWISTLVVVAGWGPVLVLASYEPVVGVPLLAVFWSGLCAFVYASRHQMAVDA